MNIQDLGSLGELIAAIATIFTLVYLAAQIRQNTNQLKGEAIREINKIDIALAQDIRDIPELWSTVMRSCYDWNSVSAKEQARAHLYLYAYTRWLETCWNLCEQKALDQKIYDSRELFILGLIGRRNGGRIWWGMWKGIFDPEFAADLDEALEAQGPETPSIMNAPFYAPEHWMEQDPPNQRL